MKATGIPHKSRDAVKARAMGRCERCGMQGSHWHHRRSRSIRDAITHSPVNGVWLCSTDHVFVHANPRQAREEGFIVSRYDDPRKVPFLRWDGALVQPDTEGGWVQEPS